LRRARRLVLTLPGEQEIAQAIGAEIDPDAIWRARQTLRVQLHRGRSPARRRGPRPPSRPPRPAGHSRGRGRPAPPWRARDERLTLLAHDHDAFNRWQAAQSLAMEVLVGRARANGEDQRVLGPVEHEHPVAHPLARRRDRAAAGGDEAERDRDPVKVEHALTRDERLTLLAHDHDAFNRWQAAQSLARSSTNTPSRTRSLAAATGPPPGATRPSAIGITRGWGVAVSRLLGTGEGRARADPRRTPDAARP
jgi:hypothetical protein